MFILDDILLAPIKFVKWMGEKVNEIAAGEMTDESKVQEELLGLQMLYEIEEISEEEYKERESKLMDRLEAIRRYKEEIEQG